MNPSLLIAVVRDMPTFRPPVYTKVSNPSGAVESCYLFTIDYEASDKKITYVADEEPSLTFLQACVVENTEWWNGILQLFLQSAAKLFSKPYTVQQINKITKHTLKGTAPASYPANVTVQPRSIQIQGGVIWVHWEYIADPITIDIPDLEEPVDLPVFDKDELEEVTGDEVPADENATEVEIDSPTKFYDKQKVKEARLRAKIAMYKAQRQMSKFYEKYGTDVTDSDTESEYASEEDQV